MKRLREEPVRVERKRFAFLPGVFVWRGRRYAVHQVVRCWTLAKGKGTRRLERRYYRLRCERGTLDLYHDLIANTWGVSADG